MFPSTRAIDTYVITWVPAAGSAGRVHAVSGPSMVAALPGGRHLSTVRGMSPGHGADGTAGAGEAAWAAG
ncbi:B3 domain-containing protein [Streptomyces laurentii]|uniref:B3 domain-containing protein n=1 Tax=Streptomyces laurentii TaxID=39478 RepID=A0A160P170_STRLU|nr:B3 domain-containing protein [Streptomyces laurentii]